MIYLSSGQLSASLRFFFLRFFIVRIDRDDYRYSGSENEEDEPALAGEPSSIVQAHGGDTLRRNFQQIQEGRTLTQDIPQPQILVKEKPAGGRGQREIPEPGPPARPAIPHRLIGNSMKIIYSIMLFISNTPYSSFSVLIVYTCSRGRYSRIFFNCGIIKILLKICLENEE